MQNKINQFETWLLKERRSPIYPILFFGSIACSAVAFLVAQTPGLEEEAGKIAVGLLIFAIIVRMLKDPVVLLFIPFFLLPLHLLFESVDDEKAAYETIGFWVISVISVSVGLAIILRAITVSEKLKKHKQCSIPPIR